MWAVSVSLCRFTETVSLRYLQLSAAGASWRRDIIKELSILSPLYFTYLLSQHTAGKTLKNKVIKYTHDEIEEEIMNEGSNLM
jgi:hypothetical protein